MTPDPAPLVAALSNIDPVRRRALIGALVERRDKATLIGDHQLAAVWNALAALAADISDVEASIIDALEVDIACGVAELDHDTEAP